VDDEEFLRRFGENFAGLAGLKTTSGRLLDNCPQKGVIRYSVSADAELVPRATKSPLAV
jgi:hypothetical protein